MEKYEFHYKLEIVQRANGSIKTIRFVRIPDPFKLKKRCQDQCFSQETSEWTQEVTGFSSDPVTAEEEAIEEEEEEEIRADKPLEELKGWKEL